MHPEICAFPSSHFYDNQLQNGLSMEASRKAVFHENKHFGPYVVFDVVDGYERVKRGSGSQSLCNEAEVDVALAIFQNLKARYVKNGTILPSYFLIVYKEIKIFSIQVFVEIMEDKFISTV
jgi:superfamily I DNA and/or RNA helicase